uniref:Uncharacterized protein n=1 Tax=Myotis myotis TaxID=51298 RepID=A0A7J7UN13_MYOMY|nr:hypothetical protein mMyoMyo1_001930 [Myotis myotis]
MLLPARMGRRKERHLQWVGSQREACGGPHSADWEGGCCWTRPANKVFHVPVVLGGWEVGGKSGPECFRELFPLSLLQSSVVLSGKQDRETKLSTPGITVPPPSPVRFFEQLSPEILPFLNQFDALPQDLLNDLLLDEGERSPCLETKTRLATRKKNPLKKSRPESSISAQMFLSVHRLTLQRPSLKYPAHLKKLYYNLNIEDRLSSAARSPGLRKQQQRQPQRKLKTPTKKPKKPEAKKKSKKDPRSQSTSHKSLGHRTLPGGESDNNQQLQMEKNGPILKQDSTERPQVGNAENDLDSFSSKQNPELSKTESSNKDFGPQMEEVPVAQEEPSKDLSSSISRASWNPELHIMRIFQTADNEAEENQLSGLQNKVTPET